MNLLKPASCGFFIFLRVIWELNVATNLIISTEFGDLTLALNYEKALHTAGYFAEESLKGTFDGGSIFRIVTEANAAMRQHSKIEVIQMGVNWPESKPITIFFMSRPLSQA